MPYDAPMGSDPNFRYARTSFGGASDEVWLAFKRYAESFGDPLRLPPPDMADPEVHVLQLPFFELNTAAQVWAGEVNARGEVFRPFVGVLTEGVVNARAEIFDGFPFAVFGLPFCVELYAHFQRLLSHPGVFQGIDDSTEEARVVWNNSADGEALLVLGSSRPEEMLGPIANSPIRRMLANRLYHWALRFIGFHELAHLVLGHVRLLEDQEQTQRIDDDRVTYQGSGYTRLRRALEHQADLHAIQRMGVWALLDSKAPWLQGDKDLLVKLMFEMFVAILGVMRLWSRGTTNVRPGVVETYPHPALRFAGLFEAVRTRLDDLAPSGMDRDSWTKGIALAHVETALQDQALSCRDPAVMWWMSGEEAIFQGILAEIRHDFSQYRVHDRLAPYGFPNAYYTGRVLEMI